MNQPDNQKLLGLALSTTSGVPLRYCIQNEIVPSAKYWLYYADQLTCNGVDDSNVAAVLVSSSHPILSVCRTICPLISKGVNIILLPEDDLVALPCLVLAEIVNKAGVACSVYRAGREKRSEIAALDGVNIVICGSSEKAVALQNTAANLCLDLDGKKAIVATETGDCDAAVDAALCVLKTDGRNSPGSYFIIQDSVMEEIIWRVRDRMKCCHAGDLLNTMTDFTDSPQFEAPGRVVEYFKGTKLDVMQVGNARIVFHAQPSLPITQWDQLGQTLLVLSYRTTMELVTILGNLVNLTELSLWVDHQAVGWQIVSQLQIPRVWINGFAHYEPGCDLLLSLRCGGPKVVASRDEKTDAALFPILDGLRTIQKNWAAQGNRGQSICKFLKQLLVQETFSAKTDVLVDLIRTANEARGKVKESTAKGGIAFEMSDPIGLVAVLASDGGSMDTLIRVVTLALLKGNAVLLSVSSAFSSSAQNLVKAAKEAGLPNVIVSCSTKDDSQCALLKHHGVRKIVVVGSAVLSPVGQFHLKMVWQVRNDGNVSTSDILRHLTVTKWIWMTVGDGLGN